MSGPVQLVEPLAPPHESLRCRPSRVSSASTRPFSRRIRASPVRLARSHAAIDQFARAELDMMREFVVHFLLIGTRHSNERSRLRIVIARSP